MSVLPPEIRDALAVVFRGVTAAHALSGGDVNRAARVTTAGGDIFVKWKTDAPWDFFALEVDGLERLRGAGALRVPNVLAVGEAPAFLALEHVPPSGDVASPAFALRLGEGLAALHKDNAAPDGKFGLPHNNYLGSQPQVNTPNASWPLFYRDCRLVPQIEKARVRGLLPPGRERGLAGIVERIEPLLADFQARPVLIHGDLWSGNFLAAETGEPVLIDPAVYYGEREIEIAYTELFGGFPVGYLAAYDAVNPLDDGYQKRRPLHQLYPLLVHLNHFGETYGPAVDSVCRAYA